MNNSNLKWKNKDGKFISLCNLTNKELKYVLKFINNSGFTHYSGVSSVEWKKAVTVHLVLDNLLTNIFGKIEYKTFKTKKYESQMYKKR